jgi:hypothetical protein
MQKTIFLSLGLLFFSLQCFSQKKKVEIQYLQEDVYVVYEEKLVGESPSYVKIDFALGGDLIFFKRGYYSQRVKIDPETIFTKLKVDLIKKPKSAAALEKKLLKPDTLLISSIITNMTVNEVQQVLDENFMENNYYIGKSVDLFPGAEDMIKNSRFKIAVEIMDNKQVRSVYKAPRFMMGYIKIRWSLLDTHTNKVVFFEKTEGTYFITLQSTKGLVISELMTRVMKGAIKEGQLKLLTNDKFVNLIAGA